MTAYHMEREIAEQASHIGNLAQYWEREAARVLGKAGHWTQLALLGRGSSGNAATFAAYLYGLATGKQAIDLRPWLVNQPQPWADWRGILAIVYSASGQSTDIAEAAHWIRQRGGFVIGVTNSSEATCRLGDAAQELVKLQVGPERAVPATKSFTAQLFMSAALCGLPLRAAAEELASWLERLGSDPRGGGAEDLASFIADARTTFWLARGPALGVAQDAALKVQETVALPSIAYSAAEFLHGPIGATGTHDRVVIFQDDEGTEPVFSKVMAALAARGTPFLHIFGSRSVDAQTSGNASHLSRSFTYQPVSERWARSVQFIVIAQSAALRLAKKTGRNPDAPGGLAKVTLT